MQVFSTAGNITVSLSCSEADALLRSVNLRDITGPIKEIMEA